MNKCIFIGRLVNDPEISSYEKNGESQAVAKYRLAINKRNKENEADFISVVAFGSNALFAEKYLTKGMQILLSSHVVTGSYVNKESLDNAYEISVDESNLVSGDTKAAEAIKAWFSKVQEKNGGLG